MDKIVVDKSRCIGCGLCVMNHPDYLVFDDNGQADAIDKEVSPEDKKAIIDTVGNCPGEALKIEDIKTNEE